MNHTCLLLGHDFQDDWTIPYIPSYVEAVSEVYWHRCCHRCGEWQSKNCATGEVTNGKYFVPLIIKYKGTL